MKHVFFKQQVQYVAFWGSKSKMNLFCRIKPILLFVDIYEINCCRIKMMVSFCLIHQKSCIIKYYQTAYLIENKALSKQNNYLHICYSIETIVR
jgi:hypothetical protein